jgi:hypothetical protein
MRWEGHVARMENMKGEDNYMERPKHRREDKIKCIFRIMESRVWG